MTELNFLNIRTHDGSKQGGFEELVCQLARLQKNLNYDKFVRINGAGGDGGIECYWQLKDGSIHGWQAKYFINKFNNSQLIQLSKSIQSAIKNYPSLTKYYICLPRDRTPQQKEKLDNKIQEWTKEAPNNNLNIEFEYWGKSEILQMLQADAPQFSGRLFYWFNEVYLTQEKLQDIKNRSKQSLGERYTPEFHVDLPIAKSFDAIVSNNRFWKLLKRQIQEGSKQFSNIENIFSQQNGNKLLNRKITEHLKNMRDVFSCVNERMNTICNDRDLSNIDGDISFIEAQGNIYKKEHTEISVIVQENEELKRPFYSMPQDLHIFQHILQDRENKSLEIAQSQAVLLQGNAGVGKSHLLCDIAIKRLQNNQPTLFLLGQHYTGGSPLDFIKRSLDLAQQSDGQVLGALDALGEASKNKTLILIDAINEGGYREDWKHHIINFVSELKKYPYIAIVLSCRTTYKEFIVPVGSELVEIYHHGFSGFEHRAAEQYLSKQGISKPNTPILSPEFSNPLFLKTCCKAIKDSGQKNFPKGMHGVEKIFNFYIDSIEKIIAHKKHYQNGENVVLNALKHFASAIYPQYIFGIPIQQARNIIESKDTKPSQHESLFDLLIDEGVLSEDIDYSNQQPIYRFTYERFSDYFIAKSLLQDVTDKNIDSIFKKQPLKDMVHPQKYLKTIGILSMLSIQIAENFKKELIDLVPRSKKKDDFEFSSTFNSIFDNTFVNTLPLRAKNSFTNRTKELLSKIGKNTYGHNWEALDILLQLSTEIEHPWNADFLHKVLIKMTMPERDTFWSIHIAISDYSEDAEENIPESPLRSLIEWAYSADLSNAETEQIRLCMIVLMWMTSTTNIKVRDQATKSLVRMLSIHPELLLELFEKFCQVNDMYVVERLYAVIYGVVVNIDNRDIILKVVTFVYNKLFIDNKPIPNILIRDYGNSIVEFANYKHLLNDKFVMNNVRPPYQSEWSIKYISEQEIEKICIDEYSSIKSSVMNFFGDFGKYTMGSVHHWSPTPITELRPETAYELQIKFAKTLDSPFKDKLIETINHKYNNKNNPPSLSIDELRVTKSSTDGKNVFLKQLNSQDIEENFKQEIDALSEEQKESYRWVMKLWGKYGSFSRKFAQRWVCKRAYELGWSEELFKKFENSHYVTGRYRRDSNKIERIGKKYQWMALYELFAYLADNYHYVGPGYGDADNLQYYGPWQLYKRNIDPTHWLRNTVEDRWNQWQDSCWWQPFTYSFAEMKDRINDWLWDKQTIPLFKKLLQVVDDEKNEWFVLHRFANLIKEINGYPKQNVRFRIDSCIVSKSDITKLKKYCKDKELSNLIKINEAMYNIFLKEYPWHNSCKDIASGDENINFSDNGLNVKYLVPVVEYSSELANNSDDDIVAYMPSKKLIDELNLSDDLKRFGEWKGHNGDVVFKDPSICEKGPSTALIKKDILLQWLNDKNLQIVWLVTGEKQVLSHSFSGKFFGRLEYSALYELSNNRITGKMWFNQVKP